MVVRPVEIDEVLAEAFEQRECDRRVVDKLAACRLPDRAADDELVVVAGGETAFFEDRVDAGRVGEFEDRLDEALIFAGADERFVGALAEHEFECADDDGFAGARFTGHADESGAEFPCEFIDECEVADFQKGEHGEKIRGIFGCFVSIRMSLR